MLQYRQGASTRSFSAAASAALRRSAWQRSTDEAKGVGVLKLRCVAIPPRRLHSFFLCFCLCGFAEFLLAAWHRRTYGCGGSEVGCVAIPLGRLHSFLLCCCLRSLAAFCLAAWHSHKELGFPNLEAQNKLNTGGKQGQYTVVSQRGGDLSNACTS